MTFDYYYGIESEQYSFYRIPRMLFQDERFKTLSNDAKLLYGLLLDRMSLSRKNGWIDEYNRVYIYYPVAEMAEDLGCSEPTAGKKLAEIDSNKGIGLVQKVRLGQGHSDTLYVMNFTTIASKENEQSSNDMEKNKEPQKLNYFISEESTPVNKNEEHYNSQNQNSYVNEREETALLYDQHKEESINSNAENETTITSDAASLEIKNFDIKKSNNLISRNQKSNVPELKNLDASYTENNYINKSISIINQNKNCIDLSQEKNRNRGQPVDKRMDDDNKSRKMEWIMKQICYDELIKKYMDDKPLIDSIVQIMYDVFTTNDVIRISGKEMSADSIKAQFVKLEKQHIEYILDSVRGKTIKSNTYGYMLTTMYHAPKTIGVWTGIKNSATEKDSKSVNRFSRFHQRNYENDQDLEKALIDNYGQ